MTHDDIIEMARQAKAIPMHKDFNQLALIGNENIEAFAKLVTAKEREACAKIVQTHYESNDDLRTKGSLASVLDYIKFRGEA